jgi:CRP-like cAMP-binding protein
LASAEIIEGLANCELFASLSKTEIRGLITDLASTCALETYHEGDHIFDQGEYSNHLYIIVEGQVLLQRSVNMGDKAATWPLGLLGRGRATGWSSLLYGPRTLTASAICQKPTRAISIEGTSLRAVLEKQPEVGFKVMDRLASLLGERLRTAYNTMEAHL